MSINNLKKTYLNAKKLHETIISNGYSMPYYENHRNFCSESSSKN